MNNNIINNLSGEIITGLITFIFTVLGAILVYKWKNRFRKITYRVFGQRLAFSEDNLYWGNIQTTYNGSPIGNLHLITVELENISSIDLENINIEFWTNDLNFIYENSGQYKHNNIFTNLKLSNEYYQEFVAIYDSHLNIGNMTGKALEIHNANYIRLNSHKIYHIPTLGRKGMGVFSFLIQNFNNVTPSMTLNCNAPNIELKVEVDENSKLKQKKLFINISDIIFFLLTVFVVYKLNLSTGTSILIITIATLGVINLISYFIYFVFIELRNLFK